MSDCTSGCPTQDHQSYAECLREKSPGVLWAKSAQGLDATTERGWQREIDNYRSAVRQGMDPNGTTTAAVRAAETWSDKHGVGYSHEAVKAVKEKAAFG